MIKLLRVDYRLVHGQVAISWSRHIGADCILVANDEVAKMNAPVNVKTFQATGNEISN